VVASDETRVMLLLPPDTTAAHAGDSRSQRIHEVSSAARAEGNKRVSARMWVHRSLGAAGVNVFDFTVSRHRDGPQEFLQDYRGTLLGDCYSGFESIVLASDSQITRAACHAHGPECGLDARLLGSRLAVLDVVECNVPISVSDDHLRDSDARGPLCLWRLLRFDGPRRRPLSENLTIAALRLFRAVLAEIDAATFDLDEGLAGAAVQDTSADDGKQTSAAHPFRQRGSDYPRFSDFQAALPNVGK
jgi:hypothetical protein